MRPALTVAEPELIKNILVKDFHLFTDRQKNRVLHPILSKHLVVVGGEDWKRIRAITSPTFSSGKMKKMYPMIKQCLNEFIEALDEYARDGKDVNVKDAYGNYTMDVIATCAFATKTNSHKDPNNQFIKSAMEVFNPKMYRLISFILLPRFVLKMMKMYGSARPWANEFFFDLTKHIIKERKASKKKYNDFIDLLITAENNIKSDKEVVVRDENDVHEAHHVNEGQEELDSERKALSGISEKYITEDEMLAQSWIFFVAGYETTATTLTFATYELALNPDVQQRLYEEVLTAVDSKGDIDYDTLSRLPYLDAVISETLRIHSPVMRLVRVANEDYKLGNTGLTILKDQSIEIPVYALHHSEEFYEQPFRFIPDRFLPENRDNIVPYSYIPFGACPRNCIGMRFALMEAKVGLAQVVRRFRFLRTAQTDVPLQLKRSMFLHSAKRVVVGIEKRA